MVVCRFFTVKSGRNRGTYVVVPDEVSRKEQVEALAVPFCCGSIQKTPSREAFYRRHSATNSTIWLVDRYNVEGLVEKVQNHLRYLGWQVESE